ncbi:hypothetical protein CQ10_40275 [Bradyrhizobium valentinum]|nr:hypothetical protein CQ10_40275 [Bradyrhizobium valentinum]
MQCSMSEAKFEVLSHSMSVPITHMKRVFENRVATRAVARLNGEVYSKKEGEIPYHFLEGGAGLVSYRFLLKDSRREDQASGRAARTCCGSWAFIQLSLPSKHWFAESSSVLARLFKGNR